jgi:thioredoxin reductase (NADPH)
MNAAVQHDLIIVGAGACGLSAAIAARALRLRALVLEAGPRPGGQLLANPQPIVDCPGLDAPSGPAAAAALLRHLGRLGGEVRTDAHALRIDAANATVFVDGAARTASAVLLTTGATRRQLGVPGEAATPGRGLSPAARRFGDRFAGRPAVVVGGGDVALEEAALLARVCPRVTLVHRGPQLRARPDFRAAVADEPRITVLLNTQLTAILGAPDVEAVTVRGPGGELRIDAGAVVISAGMAPRSELVAGQVDLDPAGFVQVDPRQRSSAPRLYAAGDVCAGAWWTVSAAVGQAGVAVKDLERRIARDEFPALLVPGPTFAPTSRGDDA